MAIRVLVVDDSRFFRNRLKALIESDPELEVAGVAEDGARAVEEALRLQPDVITMDVEMPVLDGIAAVRRIMSRRPTPILMFSSLTREGAQATLQALEAGAADFVLKRFDQWARDAAEAGRELCRRIKALARGRRPAAPPSARLAAGPSAAAPLPHAAWRAVTAPRREAARAASGGLAAVLIGASTGGPAALQQVLAALPPAFGAPLLLVQHMPAAFTPLFAQRLDALSRIRVREAADGDPLVPGQALLAPGGRQMTVETGPGGARVRVREARPGETYRPSVDLCFASAAEALGGRVLAVVLTGMGEDGRRGAERLKAVGAEVWAQDEATSMIYGMPRAVAQAGLADQVLPLERIGPRLAAKA